MNNYKYGFNDKPSLGAALPLALQHVFAAFGGTMTGAILVGNGFGFSVEEIAILIQSALLVSGIATLIQSLGFGGGIGARLPVLTQGSFTFIGTYIALGTNPEIGIGAVFGSSVIAGLILMVAGPFIVKSLSKFFTPVVTGSVVLSVGMCLLGSAYDKIVAFDPTSPDIYTNLAIAGATFMIIMLLNQFAKGILKVSSIIVGIACGFGIAVACGMVDFSSVANSSVVSVPKPFNWGVGFDLGAVVTMCILHIATIMEVIGDVTGVTSGIEDRLPTEEELTKAVRADGLGSAVGAVFNGLPMISGSANIGIICMTGVASRFITALAGVIFLLVAFFPPLSQMLALTPDPVLGGALLSLFATIAGSGIKVMSMEKITNRNATIIGLAIALGIGGYVNKEALVFLPSIVTSVFTGISGTALIALFLNIVLPKEKQVEESQA